MIGVSFYHRVVPPSQLHARNGGIFFSKFLYVRDFPEYRGTIAHAQGCCTAVLRSRKTYSRYLKKFPRPEMPQYFYSPSTCTTVLQGWPRNKARLTFSNSDNFLELKYFYLIFEQAESLLSPDYTDVIQTLKKHFVKTMGSGNKNATPERI